MLPNEIKDAPYSAVDCPERCRAMVGLVYKALLLLVAWLPALLSLTMWSHELSRNALCDVCSVRRQRQEWMRWSVLTIFFRRKGKKPILQVTIIPINMIYINSLYYCFVGPTIPNLKHCSGFLIPPLHIAQTHNPRNHARNP
jgi:hypothetical protein